MNAYLFDGFRRFELVEGLNSIGRDRRSNSIFLEDEQISRFHAWIVGMADGTWLLMDRRSSNGCWVGEHVMDRGVLRNLDELRFGETRLVFCLEGEDEEVEEEPDPDSLRGSWTVRGSRLRELAEPPGRASPEFAEPTDRILQLHRVCRHLLEVRSRETLVGEVLAWARVLCAGDRARLWSCSPSGQLGELLAGEGLSENEGTTYLLQLYAAWVAERREPRLWTDLLVGQPPPAPAMRRVMLWNVRSAVVVPVVSRTVLVGVLAVDNKIQGEEFRPGELRIAVDLARVLGAGWGTP